MIKREYDKHREAFVIKIRVSLSPSKRWYGSWRGISEDANHYFVLFRIVFVCIENWYR